MDILSFKLRSYSHRSYKNIVERYNIGYNQYSAKEYRDYPIIYVIITKSDEEEQFDGNEYGSWQIESTYKHYSFAYEAINKFLENLRPINH
ncbi:MAG: hypothetical protein WDO19_02515 [Bacteroidota bacterium]